MTSNAASALLFPSPLGRGWREAPGEGPHSCVIPDSTSMSFSARLPGGWATFVSAKVAKTIAPGMTVSATSCCRNFPALLAPSGPARTRTSLCSNIRALLPLGAAMLGVVQRRVDRSNDGHPWPRTKRESATRFAPSRAQDVRQTGPLEHGERTTDKSAGWRTGSAPVRRRHRDVPSANPGGRERIRSTRTCGGRVRGVAFLLVTSLWPSKEKSPARAGGARKKTGMSSHARW